MVFRLVYDILHSHWQYASSCCFTSYHYLVLPVFQTLAILTGVQWYLVVVLICISLVTWYRASFMSLFAFWISYLMRCLFRSMAHFFLMSLRVFSILGYEVFIRYVFLKYFLPACDLSSHYLNNVFHRAENTNF